jgi:hypothetical protein
VDRLLRERDARLLPDHPERNARLPRDELADAVAVGLGDGGLAPGAGVERLRVPEFLALPEQLLHEAERHHEGVRDLLAGVLSRVVAGEYAHAHVGGDGFHAATIAHGTE